MGGIVGLANAEAEAKTAKKEAMLQVRTPKPLIA